MSRHTYRTIAYGADAIPAGLVVKRHRHDEGYATLVLGGELVEASFSGRAAACAGDVLLHARFDCHSNWCWRRRTLRIVRLPWDDDLEGHFRVRDPDLIARLAERDPFEATVALRDSLEPHPSRAADWPEALAHEIRNDPSIAIRAFAECEGLAPETISRGFRQAFDVAPRAFRLEVRARLAWNAVVRSDRSLTTIAHELAFADLAHMSRSITVLTGRSPTAWRQLRSS